MHKFLILDARHPCRQRLIGWLLGWLLMASMAGQALAEAPQVPAASDVRVLVDISGSMKQTDPDNLRQPAIRLIARLLPPDSEAGIWTFGQYVNMLVKQGPVNDAWRALATQKSTAINSVALFTNIGRALEVASADLKPGKTYQNTHFILLTDGKVDIDKSPITNLKERQRVLSGILSKFKSAGAHIHTIALSEQSDRALLDRLAVETNGSYTLAKSAEDLSRAFVGVFDKAVPAEQVPLNNNRFTVDGSINEFTALIFHKPGTPTHLKTPGGKLYDAKTIDSQVSWLAEKQYDLITVKSPQAGDWTIDAAMEKDSRVTIISDLRMLVSDVPAFFYAGDTVALQAAFYDKTRLLTDQDLLSLIDVDLTIATGDGREGTKRLSDPTAPPKDGVFSDVISKLEEPGNYTVTFHADGKTFERIKTQTMTLRPPVDLELQAESTAQADAHTESQGAYRINVTPRNPALVPASMKATLNIATPDGQVIQQSLVFDEHSQAWAETIKPNHGDGTYRLSVDLQGNLSGGQALHFVSGVLQAVFPLSGDTTVPQLPDAATPAIVPPVVEMPAVEPEPEPAVSAHETAASEAPQPLVPDLSDMVETPTQDPVAAETGSKIPTWLYWVLGSVLVLALLVGGMMHLFRIKRRRVLAAANMEAAAPAATAAEVLEAEVAAAASQVITPEPEPEPEPELATLDDEIAEAAPDAAMPDDLVPEEVPEEQPEVPTLDIEEAAAEEAVTEDESVAEESIPVVTAQEEAADQSPETEADDMVQDQAMADIDQLLQEAADQSVELTPEQLAEQIMDENMADPAKDEEEFDLEEFDISDIEDLPDSETPADTKRDPLNQKKTD